MMITYTNLHETLQTAAYDSGMNVLTSDGQRILDRLMCDTVWPHVFGHSDQIEQVQAWGVMAGILAPIHHVLKLTIESSASRQMLYKLGFCDAEVDEFKRLSRELPLLDEQMRPVLNAMLVNSDELTEWQKLEDAFWDLSVRANARHRAARGFTAPDLTVLIRECVSTARFCEEVELPDYVERIMSLVDASWHGQQMDTDELAAMIVEAQDLYMDMIEWAPPSGYTDLYAECLAACRYGVDSGTMAEARLVLNDQDLVMEAFEDYRTKHPEDKWMEHMPKDWWPDVRESEGLKRMPLLDSFHHYILEDFKESGRSSGGSRRGVLERLGLPHDRTRRERIQRIRRTYDH